MEFDGHNSFYFFAALLQHPQNTCDAEFLACSYISWSRSTVKGAITEWRLHRGCGECILPLGFVSIDVVK